MKNTIIRENILKDDIERIREEGQNKAIFPFPNFNGVNNSEKILIDLCKNCFLSLWTLPNLYKQKAKELADVLIVFEDNIIIISDKEGHSQTENLKLKWNRFKKHIEKSQNQLLGAKRWIEKYPDRIFIDPQCNKKIFHELPKNPKFHLLTVLRGWKKDSQHYYKNNDGSLPIDYNPNKIMSIISKNTGNSFIHIFDEIGIEFVLKELNTISDFINYLVEREKFFKKNKKIKSFGETPLLGSFLLANNNNLNKPPFEVKAKTDSSGNLIYNKNIYYNLISTDSYKLWYVQQSKSLFIDLLIERFINIGDPKESFFEYDHTVNEVEFTIREFAKLCRKQRIDFYNALEGLLEKCNQLPTVSPVRTFFSPIFPDTVFVILFYLKDSSDSFPEYRRKRMETLLFHCEKARLNKDFVFAKKFFGFATDHIIRDYKESSEDICVIEQEDGEKYDIFENVNFFENNEFIKLITIKNNSTNLIQDVLENVTAELNKASLYFPSLDNTLNNFIEENAINYPFRFILRIKESNVILEAL